MDSVRVGVSSWFRAIYGSLFSLPQPQPLPLPVSSRDGVLRFADKTVDFARDSLVYELPYLDPAYDYYLKVYSYREEGSNWAQGLSVDGSFNRAIQFASNRVDGLAPAKLD